jgi:hypothetical protein
MSATALSNAARMRSTITANSVNHAALASGYACDYLLFYKMKHSSNRHLNNFIHAKNIHQTLSKHFPQITREAQFE